MDYAVHGHAIAHIQFGESEIDCNVKVRHRTESSLMLDLPQSGAIPPLPTGKVFVHFEINHTYFDGLHKAVDCLNEHAIKKLFPSKRSLKRATTGNVLTRRNKSAVKPFQPDYEYQMNALGRMTSSDPRVPFLVLGPFGTGKTRILAAAASVLLCDRNSHVLVCTYQHQCANTIYEILFEKYKNEIMRLVPSVRVAKHIQHGQSGVTLLKDVTPKRIAEKRVIVITFLTATNLRGLERESGQQLHFSHILIDEGAQAREPESLGALSVVKQDTKIVIVGDHKQVRMHSKSVQCSDHFYSFRVVPE